MNAIRGRAYRFSAVSLLVGIGILTAVVAGCGGGGGGGTGGTGPTLAITIENGEAAATAVATSVLTVFDIPEGVVAPIIEPTAVNLSVSRDIGKVTATLAQAPVSGTESCDVSGTVSLSGNLADPTTLTEGDTLTAVFDSCDVGYGFVLDGRLALTVAAIQGDISSDVFLMTLNMGLTNLIVTSEGVSSSGDGFFIYTLDALAYPAIVTRVSGSELRVVAAGDAVTFRDFDQSLEVDMGVVPTSYAAEATGRLHSSALGGSVDYGTTETIRAIGDDNPPYTGEILLIGADSSELRIVVVDEETVRLEIDLEGDGVIDEFIDTTWAALIGELSS